MFYKTFSIFKNNMSSYLGINLRRHESWSHNRRWLLTIDLLSFLQVTNSQKLGQKRKLLPTVRQIHPKNENRFSSRFQPSPSTTKSRKEQKTIQLWHGPAVLHYTRSLHRVLVETVQCNRLISCWHITIPLSCLLWIPLVAGRFFQSTRIIL